MMVWAPETDKDYRCLEREAQEAADLEWEEDPDRDWEPEGREGDEA